MEYKWDIRFICQGKWKWLLSHTTDVGQIGRSKKNTDAVWRTGCVYTFSTSGRNASHADNHLQRWSEQSNCNFVSKSFLAALGLTFFLLPYLPKTHVGAKCKWVTHSLVRDQSGIARPDTINLNNNLKIAINVHNSVSGKLCMFIAILSLAIFLICEISSKIRSWERLPRWGGKLESESSDCN